MANRSDQYHANVVPIYRQYPQIFLPQLVLVEVAYLIGRDAGIPTVVKFLQSLPDSRFELVAAEDQDIALARKPPARLKALSLYPQAFWRRQCCKLCAIGYIIRVASILERYIDSKVDFVDACVMAMAERLNILTILTIDQRDFRLFRPSHCESFTLLP
ncbi:MAG: type II toxin-antitoxin system VapC family toxin [Leptolyngbyaceae cyanobacterium]